LQQPCRRRLADAEFGGGAAEVAGASASGLRRVAGARGGRLVMPELSSAVPATALEMHGSAA